MLPFALKPFKPLKVSTTIVQSETELSHTYKAETREEGESLLPTFTTEREADSHL